MTISVHYEPRDGLQMDGTELNDEIGPNKKGLSRIIGLLKCPP